MNRGHHSPSIHQVDAEAPITVARWTCEEGVRRRPARVVHGHAALAFYTGGSSRVELRGEWELSEGDVLVVPPGEPHRMLSARQPELWGLGLCVSCLEGEAQSSSLLEPFNRVREGGAAVVHIEPSRRGYVGELFAELERVLREPEEESALGVAVERSLLTLILAEVNRASSALDVRRAKVCGVALEALRFIERNCLRPLTLHEVAAAVGRSPAYVTTSLSRATGRSAVAWIVSGRMAEARRLLLHSDEKIDVIAERVGYADPTHFIRMFRREHGETPNAWRAAARRRRILA